LQSLYYPPKTALILLETASFLDPLLILNNLTASNRHFLKRAKFSDLGLPLSKTASVLLETASFLELLLILKNLTASNLHFLKRAKFSDLALALR